MRFCTAAVALLAAAGLARADVKTEVIEYDAAGTRMKGYLAYDAAQTGKRPGVVVFPEWWGLNDDAKKRATMLADLGYVAFCADMYGDGKQADHPTDAGKMATEVRKNVDTWLARGRAAVKVLADRPEADATKIGAIGYCFGGTTALQLALAGDDIKAVAAFHAGLPPVTADQAKKVKGRILLAQGGADKMIPPAKNEAFRKAVADAGATIKLEEYPGATHSYTVEGIDKKAPELGMKYDADADKKAWESMKELFAATLK